jgi:hypothetical protein
MKTPEESIMAVEDPWKPPQSRPALEEPPKIAKPPWFSLAVLLVALSYLAWGGYGKVILIGLGFPVALFLFWVYLLLPLRTRRTFWNKVPEIREVDPDTAELPPGLAEGYRATAEALVKLGFTERGLYFLDKPTRLANSYLGLFANSSEQTVCRWIFIVTPYRTIAPVVGFATRFANGQEFATSNSSIPVNHPLPKTRDGLAFPGLKDLARLLRLHNRRIAEKGEFSSRVSVLAGDPVESIRTLMTEEMNQNVKSGYYWFETSTGLYRFTLKGAYLTSWKYLWPWGLVRIWKRRWIASRMIRKLEASG